MSLQMCIEDEVPWKSCWQAALWAGVCLFTHLTKHHRGPEQEAGNVSSGMSRTFRTMRQLAVIMPLASSGSTAYLMLIITRAMASFIKLYLLLLFIRVLLSWFPTFNWDKHPWLALRQVCLPFTAPTIVCSKPEA